MGGHKRSELEFDRKRAERLRLLREAGTMYAQVQELTNEIRKALRSATCGIRSTFSAEVASAERWCERVSAVADPVSAGDSDLPSQHAELTDLLAGGEATLGQLLFCFSRKGDQMAHELAQRLVTVRTLLAKHQATCAPWFAEDVHDWEKVVDRASQLHDSEDYLQSARLLDETESRIHVRADEAVELTKQQQSRSYLLKGVRQVCCNMGLRELSAPRLERTDDPLSRILLTVASPDKGQLRLALSLDGIQSLGEVRECEQDLRQFSELLSDQFGIRTQFRGLTDEDPQLAAAGRRERPHTIDDAHHTRG